MISMLAVVFVGLLALIQQILHGHIVTGMRDNVVWGIFIVNFIFFLGIGYSGAIIASVFHLANIKWARPIQRIPALFGLIGLCVGPIFILLCIGRLDRLHYLFMYARIQSPITWDVMAIMTNLVFIFTYLYITHIRDFAKLRDTQLLDLPKWKRKLFGKLALGYVGNPEQVKNLNKARNVLAATIIPCAILADSLLAWLFGMSLRPGWHSTLFAPEFILVALFSGVAVLIVLMAVYRKQYNLYHIITDVHFQYAGYALLLCIIGFSYFTFSEYITEWYNVSETHGRWINKFMDMEEYGMMSLFTISFTIIIPLLVLIIPKIRTPRSISFISLLVLVGLWLKRYLIIVPTLETPYFPIQDLRVEYVHYSATWVEWALSAAGLAFAIILLMLFNLLAPVVPVGDLEHHDEIVVPKPFYKTLESKK